MTLFQDDGSALFREPRPSPESGPGSGPGRSTSGRRVVIAMSVLAAVAAGLLVLTMLPSGPLSWIAHYSMSSSLAAVADRIGFTDEGRALFESTEPELLTGDAFIDACIGDDAGTDDDAGSTVGCYYGYGGSGGRIAIFEPGDDRLADQVAVTAAHEFLHAAFDRIDPAELGRLEALLDARWAELPDDDPLRDTFEMSVGDDPDAVATEEFAYLGSEAADTGPELEAFYAPYFRDRQAVVAMDAADDALWAGMQSDYEAAVDAATSADRAVADQRELLAQADGESEGETEALQAGLREKEAEAVSRRSELDRLDADYDALIAASMPY